jgi:transposase
LRLPPYHCQFNLIELVWGICKQYYDSHIGRDRYGDGNIKSMWLEALSTVTLEVWNISVEHTANEIIKRWRKEKIIDAQEVEPLRLSVNTGD